MRQWCRGNTTAFQAVIKGSNPFCRSTELLDDLGRLRLNETRAYSSMAEQAAHNRWVLGSNPSRPMIKLNTIQCSPTGVYSPYTHLIVKVLGKMSHHTLVGDGWLIFHF